MDCDNSAVAIAQLCIARFWWNLKASALCGLQRRPRVKTTTGKKEISRHRPPLSSISVATTLFAWKMRPLIGSLRTPRTSFATYITIAEYAVTNNQYERTKANWYGGTTVARACYVVFACENCWTAGVRHDSLTVSISASHCGPAARCRRRFGTYQKHTFRYSGCTQLNAIIFSWLIRVFRNIAYT